MDRCAAMNRDEVEEHLVEACQRGDRDAFRRLFEAYKDKIYSIALYFFRGDEASAEDVTQDVFLRVFTRIGQFRSEAGFGTWLYRLVSNACVDELRKRKRFVPYESMREVEDRSTPPLDAAAFFRHEWNDAIQAALGAEALGCSKGTIASRLNRCHKILAQKLGPLRDDASSGDDEC
jgi:RNA polymerase sigma-70 factor (ECF subfamily)